ncbi:MAG TPA: GMC family oxidoreductase [Rhizomicrobium sp.]
MIIDLETVDPLPDFACDIAVVGAGAVGIPLAVALAQRGKRVLLLEGGGVGLEKSSQDLTQSISLGQELEGLEKGRFRMLGGTSNFWGGQLAEFQDIVFEPRTWLDSDGWPFGRDVLGPYYQAALRMLGMAGCASDPAVFASHRIEGPAEDGPLELFLTRWLKNPNLAQMFHQELNGAALPVVVHANLVGLKADRSGSRVTELALRTLSGRTVAVKAGTVVLSCGTIEICRQLQLPFVDGRPAPWGGNPWLGRGFLDHIDSTAGEVKILDPSRFHDLFDTIYSGGFKFTPKMRLKASAQQEMRGVEIAGVFAFRSSLADHLVNFKILLRALRNGRGGRELWKLPAATLSVARVLIPMVVRYIRANRMFNPVDGGVLLRLMSEQWPNRDSRIGLASERDALGLPKVEIDWAIDGREIETCRRFALFVRDWLRRTGLADIDIDPLLLAGDRAYFKKADDGFHQMGGARMASSAKDGVVDKDLKVFGSENLYVAGAAVYPCSGYANPTLTAIALGQRLADKLCA